CTVALRERGATVHAPAIAELDLGDEAAVAAWYAALPAVWASIHLVGGFVMKPIAETTLADLDRMLALNTRTTFVACREAVVAMRRSGGGGGRIVNVIARPALVPAPSFVAYAASKAAVASITQTLAAELVAEGIFCNAIAPSIIDTPANRASMPDADFDRWPKAAELARVIADLASPENRVTSGALVPVYGRA
ncbi:MAG: SDR family oxidoreductase, partial [Deltaproteobacteria bacterium]|nr:SDR family oxidoreductase [Kofleriaceae bacterium]